MSAREVTKRGRPLVFLAVLAIAWIGMRLAVLSAWQEGESAAPIQTEPAVRIAVRSGKQVQTTVADDEAAGPEVTQQAPDTAEHVVRDAPPPGHQKKDFDPLPAAAANNALKMDASSDFDAALSPPVATLSEPRREEEF